MVNYRKILEYHFNGMTQRTIGVAVGSSRNTIRDVVKKAQEKELIELTDYFAPSGPPIQSIESYDIQLESTCTRVESSKIATPMSA